MNYSISIIFRTIPIVMALFCFSYGGYIYLWTQDASRLIAGPVVFFLGAICLALYATAATIIRQIIGTYGHVAQYALPLLAYVVSLITIVAGAIMLHEQPVAELFVAGHVVCGLGFIALCVSTAATASTRFALIPLNSAAPETPVDEPPTPNPKGFSDSMQTTMVGFTAFIAILAWAWAVVLLSQSMLVTHLVAGSVMGGIACVCTSLIALVLSIARQVSNTYTESDRVVMPRVVVSMGVIAVVWGLLMIFVNFGLQVDFVGFILLGLGMVCLSISSKVILLARIWHRDYPLANRIPLIPIFTALFLLFLGGFLFEEAFMKDKFFVPARVLMGLGAICFTLFSIVSILESGASRSK